jgi:GNAT superfamily N-acetyltransferase
MSEWGITNRQELIREWLSNDDRLDAGAAAYPIMFAAFLGNEFVGTVGIDSDDLPKVDHGFSPWLVSLIVVEEHRGQGFGKELVEHVLRYCRDKGVISLHLWAEKPHLEEMYTRWGWSTIRRVAFSKHESVPIMNSPL